MWASWNFVVTLVVVMATTGRLSIAQTQQVLTSSSADVAAFVPVKVRPNLGPQEVQPLTQGLQRDLLDDHNNKRRIETNMGALGVENLAWDADIAKSAQAVAASCNFQHTQPGQNLYASSPAGGQPISPQAVNTWYEEKKVYDYDTNTCSGKCGDYLQVVWDDTTHVGCGYVRCEKLTEGPNELFGGKSADFLVCHYNPVGNVIPAGETEPRRPFQRSTDPCTTKPIDCGLTGRPKVEGDACVCDCFPGFTGPTCKTDLCGHCSFDGTDYTEPGPGKCDCVCLPGFSGTDCANDVCAVCQKEGFGDPVRSDDGCDCQCWTGFSGSNCNIECPSNCADCSSSTSCTDCIPNFQLASSGNCVAQSPCETSTITCLNGNKGVRLFDCVCECNAGFSGDQCEKDHCAECDPTGTATPVPGDGTCACTCRDGYTGDQCQTACPANCVNCTDVSTCSQCASGLGVHPTTGICVALNLLLCDNSNLNCGDHGKKVVSGDKCVCQCDDGYSGEDCKTDECATCLPLGTASTEPGDGSCKCTCKTGFSGDKCNIDVCEQCMKEGTGTPVRSATSCECKCFDGFLGENCQIDMCDKCDPFGTQVVVPSGQDCTCKCYLGFTGPNCENDECAACEDEGFGDAVRTGSGCDCQCWRGFTGQNCDIECSSNCAECTDENTCTQCNPGYHVDATTKRCIKVTPCDTSNIVCENDGKKVVKGNDCVCQCPRGYGGDRCQTDHCAACSLKGTSDREPGEDKCTCICHPGFSGDHCSTDNCATCVQEGNGTPVRSFETCDCHCNAGFTGDNCETACPASCVKCSRTGICTQCQPGLIVVSPGCRRLGPCELSTINCGDHGTTVEKDDTCVCSCGPGWMGELCDKPSTCEQQGGTCIPYVCPRRQYKRERRYDCPTSGQVCCIPKASSACESAGNTCMRNCRRRFTVDPDPSHTCDRGRTCCVGQRSECENAGGRCLAECRGGRPVENTRYSCDGNQKCCVRQTLGCVTDGGRCMRQCRRNLQPDDSYDCGQDRTCCVRPDDACKNAGNRCMPSCHHPYPYVDTKYTCGQGQQCCSQQLTQSPVSLCLVARGQCMSDCGNNMAEDNRYDCGSGQVCCMEKKTELPNCGEAGGICYSDCNTSGFVHDPNYACPSGGMCCLPQEQRADCESRGGKCGFPHQCRTQNIIPNAGCAPRGNKDTVCCWARRG